MAVKLFDAVVNENGSLTLLGRVCARDATGATSPYPREGKLIQQADLAAAPDGVQIRLYDLASSTPATSVQSANPTISTVIYNTLQTSEIWTLLTGGGNFLYDVPASWLADPNKRYRIEVRFETTGGTIGWGKFNLTTDSILGA